MAQIAHCFSCRCTLVLWHSNQCGPPLPAAHSTSEVYQLKWSLNTVQSMNCADCYSPSGTLPYLPFSIKILKRSIPLSISSIFLPPTISKHKFFRALTFSCPNSSLTRTKSFLNSSFFLASPTTEAMLFDQLTADDVESVFFLEGGGEPHMAQPTRGDDVIRYQRRYVLLASP